MEIIGNVKNYDWGKLGTQSEVARLALVNSEDLEVDANTPYSELWMGDHPSGPSKIKSTGELLGDFIRKNRSGLIGGHTQLPFLLKVLSIRKALSIQVHPNKTEAESLHSAHPDIYKDANHKPELAIALTPFLALCGFRPYKEIYIFCQKLPSLQELIGQESIDKLETGKSEALKECYSSLMNSTQSNITRCIQEILVKSGEVLKANGLFEIFNRLNTDFTNDVGILSLFFLNIIHLKPGEAIFLSANVPHAYLSGDCIECMACSDNVIRAGLTPKFKDISTLLRMLNYEAEPAEDKLFQSVRIDAYSELFAPKIKDFAVLKICVPSTESSYQLENRGYGAILLVLGGKCILKTEKLTPIPVARGSTVFIPGDCGTVIELCLTGENHEDFIAYKAMYNNF